MKKTKTNKKIFTIFSAILGVVFAFLVGITYCASSLDLHYGTKENSTSAFMGNQQFHLINDTTVNPVPFGEGAHNFEIALQYAVDYNFDIRLKYTLTWSNGQPADNVILNFADRDNIIYDENYIYLADSVAAGSGKLTIITGVEFVDTEATAYNGATLSITIKNSDVKIYKEQASYTTSHYLYSGLSNYDSAKAWLQYKQNKTATTSNAYVMMYNYRRNYAHGIAYPGLNSAYKKPAVITTETITTGEGDDAKTTEYLANNIYAPVWTGGNRAYAGTGMYIITGSTSVEVEVQVAGIWRTSGQTELASENNFQYNYTNNWVFENYSANSLWEVRSFKFFFPAKTSCYVDILDSVEITSAGTVVSTDYRLVTNQIVVNATTFSYGESVDNYIQFGKLNATTTTKTPTTARTSYANQDRNISVINTTMYTNGLFDTFGNMNVSQQRYNANITLINNTNQTRNVSVSLDLFYHVSNGQTTLYNSEKLRAVDLIDRTTNSTYTYKNAFDSDTDYSAVNTLYYSYTDETDNLYYINTETVLSTYTIQLAPYASANLVSSYDVSADLGQDILGEFNDPTTTNRNEYYDVWTYLVPTVSSSVVQTPTSSNLTLEATQTASATIISVKNNTNQKITGISIEDLTVRKYDGVNYQLATSENAPNDWSASYWKYYTKSGDTYTQVSSNSTKYEKNKYYLKTQSYSNETIAQSNLLNSFTLSSSKITNTSKVLLPGESVQVATIATTAKVNVSGTVTTSSLANLTEIAIINNGTTNAYIVNYSSNSYYLRFSGTATGTNVEKIDGYNYYIGVVRPNQIINLSMTAAGAIGTNDKIVASGDYTSTLLTSSPYSWSTNAAARYTSYFNINK